MEAIKNKDPVDRIEHYIVDPLGHAEGVPRLAGFYFIERQLCRESAGTPGGPY